MKRMAMAVIVVATSMLLGSAAYAQGAHGTPKSEPAAGQVHDAHCCKPDTSDMKGMQGMAEHDHAQVPKKPAKKSAEKAAKAPEAK